MNSTTNENVPNFIPRNEFKVRPSFPSKENREEIERVCCDLDFDNWFFIQTNQEDFHGILRSPSFAIRLSELEPIL